MQQLKLTVQLPERALECIYQTYVCMFCYTSVFLSTIEFVRYMSSVIIIIITIILFGLPMPIG